MQYFSLLFSAHLQTRPQYEHYLSALNQNNYELWADFFSEENFSKRIKHETELYKITITALASDLAISTQFGRWKTHWTDRDYTKTTYHASFLWKKEKDGWKIIHVNETGFPEFE